MRTLLLKIDLSAYSNGVLFKKFSPGKKSTETCLYQIELSVNAVPWKSTNITGFCQVDR